MWCSGAKKRNKRAAHADRDGYECCENVDVFTKMTEKMQSKEKDVEKLRRVV